MTKPLVFLGEWCRRYSRRGAWEKQGTAVLPNPWADHEKSLRAAAAVDSLYTQYLDLLAPQLNSLHGIRGSARYWQVVIGPWLQVYLAVAYDRYTRAKEALRQYPGLTTIALNEDCFVIPADFTDFQDLVRDDAYNLQMFTRVFDFLGKTFPKRKFYRPPTVSPPDAAPERRSKRAVAAVANLLVRLLPSANAIVLKNTYFPWTTELGFFVRSMGAVRRITQRAPRFSRMPIDAEAREEIRRALPGTDDFHRFLKRVLPLDLPQSYVEGFAAIREFVKREYPGRPKAILTANALYEDESFKQWMAECADAGSILLGTPHGTCYGGFVTMRSEEHETAVADRYYSWGWERSEYRSQVVPMPAPRLLGRGAIGASNSKDGVLWATTIDWRYVTEFPVFADRFAEYLAWQARFLGALGPEFLRRLRLRPHYQDFGWDLVQRLKDLRPELAIETWEAPFVRSLRNCRLYVCDHGATTYGEALALDKPTILFWSHLGNEMRPEAEPYYEELRRAGILYHSPEEAAAAVQAVYPDVEGWWNEPSRQEARRVFCDRFARTSSRAVQEWMAEFRRVQRLSPGQSGARARRDSTSPGEAAQEVEIGATTDVGARERH
ncbi:MAG: LIC12162 family protein [Acidobacteriota bacterium]|nr:LIC12162 family protein [Acidobacteriota bacterium]